MPYPSAYAARPPPPTPSRKGRGSVFVSVTAPVPDCAELIGSVFQGFFRDSSRGPDSVPRSA